VQRDKYLFRQQSRDSGTQRAALCSRGGEPCHHASNVGARLDFVEGNNVDALHLLVKKNKILPTNSLADDRIYYEVARDNINALVHNWPLCSRQEWADYSLHEPEEIRKRINLLVLFVFIKHAGRPLYTIIFTRTAQF